VERAPVTAERCNLCGRPLVEPEHVGRGVCLPTCGDVEGLDAAFDVFVAGLDGLVFDLATGPVVARLIRCTCLPGAYPCECDPPRPSRIMRGMITGAMFAAGRGPGVAIGALAGGLLAAFDRDAAEDES
jgi:hypothetical protein